MEGRANRFQRGLGFIADELFQRRHLLSALKLGIQVVEREITPERFRFRFRPCLGDAVHFAGRELPDIDRAYAGPVCNLENTPNKTFIVSKGMPSFSATSLSSSSAWSSRFLRSASASSTSSAYDFCN